MTESIARMHVHHLDVLYIPHPEMVRLILRDGKEIQVYSIDVRKRKILQVSFQS